MKKIATFLFCTASMFCAPIGNADDMETVEVIGTGDMGDSLGPRFAQLGYRVVYGSRNPESERVKALVNMTGESTSEGLVPPYDEGDLAEFPETTTAVAPCPK